jgi:hypothetical protein
VETLQDDLKCLRKENETLRFMLDVMNSKCSILQAHLQEAKAGQMDIDLTQTGFNNEANKRARTSEVPIHNKTQRFLVRTDPDQDNSLVSLLDMLLCVSVLLSWLPVKFNQYFYSFFFTVCGLK